MGEGHQDLRAAAAAEGEGEEEEAFSRLVDTRSRRFNRDWGLFQSNQTESKKRPTKLGEETPHGHSDARQKRRRQRKAGSVRLGTVAQSTDDGRKRSTALK